MESEMELEMESEMELVLAKDHRGGSSQSHPTSHSSLCRTNQDEPHGGWQHLHQLGRKNPSSLQEPMDLGPWDHKSPASSSGKQCHPRGTAPTPCLCQELHPSSSFPH